VTPTLFPLCNHEVAVRAHAPCPRYSALVFVLLPAACALLDSLWPALFAPALFGYLHGGAPNPKPCTLHPAPCTLHPAPCTLKP
jgi:hypothetical protein